MKDDWGAAIPIYIILLFTAVTVAVGFAKSGYPRAGLVGFGLTFVLAISFIANFCGLDAILEGETYSMIFTFVMVGLALAGSFLQFPLKERAMKPGGALSWLLYRNLGKRGRGAVYEENFIGAGPLNDFLEMSIMEWIWAALITAWLATAAYWKYSDSMSESDPVGIEGAYGNKTRAIGRAFATMAVRLIFLSLVSGSRNVVLYQLMNVPFERAMKFHQIVGRVQVMVMYCHVICMATGGVTRRGSPDVELDSHFSLIRGVNIIPGIIALIFWTFLVIGSLNYFRRKFWDAFYFMHIQFFFMANVMTIFHNRLAVVWIASAIALWYVDVILRVLAKLQTVTVKEISLVEDNQDSGGASIVKLVLNQEGYPVAPNKHHPGAYVWMSIGGIKSGPLTEKQADHSQSQSESDDAAAGVELVTPHGAGATQTSVVVAPSEEAAEKQEQEKEQAGTDKVMPAGFQGLPSWVWFHAMTISGFDEETKDLTFFIKSKAGMEEEWTGQLVRLARDVSRGQVDKDCVKFFIGGPHGSLQVQPDEMDSVVLVAAGIGITPMASILEDRLRGKRAKRVGSEGKVSLVWASRSYSELQALHYLIEQAGEFPDDVTIQLYYTGEENPEAGKGGLEALLALPNVSLTQGRFVLASEAVAKAVLPSEDAKASAKVGIYVCGPHGICIDAEEFCSAKRADGFSTYFHRETFDL